MKRVYYDKYYNTRTIRSIFFTFISMIEKEIDYEYLMLKNKEEVTYKKLSAVFPLFTRKRFRKLIYYLEK